MLEALKRALGISTVTGSTLNSRATNDRPIPPSAVNPPNPLDGIEISPEYDSVRRLIEAGAPVILVSGKAGTGKSTLIHYLRHALAINTAVVSPTGVAALNVGGSTIHSFFRLPPRVILPEDIKKVSDRNLYKRLDLLIVDEISMVRADLFDGMDAFLRLNGKDEKSAFGGTRILMVGDLFQLPPVVTKEEEATLFSRGYQSPYFFSAHSFQSLEVLPVELPKIYRQRDPAFTDLLGDIREASRLETVVPTINARCMPSSGSTTRAIMLTCTNAVADQINSTELARLPGDERLFTGVIQGKYRIEKARLPSPLDLRLKVGARVMFTKNDPEKRWVNGSIGILREFRSASILVEMVSESPGSLHDALPVTWTSYKYKYDFPTDRIIPASEGSYTQYPLMLAWAVTIHKSQGKTLASVKIDLGSGAFTSGQAYVAFSRCRSLEDISLTRPLKARDVICDDRIRRFYRELNHVREYGK